MKRFALLLAIIGGLLLGSGSMAWAAPPEPKPVVTIGAPTPSPSGGVSALDTRHCDVWTNPYPQYSASNRTLHFGGKITCNYSDQLWVDATLFHVVGTGDKQHNVWASSIANGSTGTWHGNTIWDACIGTTPATYILRVTGSPASLPSAYGWSPTYTYPCTDVV
jgi:hypothetical protein